MTALLRLQRKIGACQLCNSLVSCRSRVVPGDGAAPARIAFVGIAPGRFGGDRTGIPFSGDRSGAQLRLMIARADLRDVFITNLVRCSPRDASGRNRDPSRVEIANCRAHLYSELALVRPQLIVCLGRLAWRELAGPKVQFAPLRHALEPTRGTPIVAMYHPGYVIRGAYSKARYARDFKRLARLASLAGDPCYSREASLNAVA